MLVFDEKRPLFGAFWPGSAMVISMALTKSIPYISLVSSFLVGRVGPGGRRREAWRFSLSTGFLCLWPGVTRGLSQ
jgi:hypothetical protein